MALQLGDVVRYLPKQAKADSITGTIKKIDITARGYRFLIEDYTGETHKIFDYRGYVTRIAQAQETLPDKITATIENIQTKYDQIREQRDKKILALLERLENEL